MIVPLNMAGFVLECHREGEADLSRWQRKMQLFGDRSWGSTYDEIKSNSGVIWVLGTSLMATTDPVKSFILSTGEHFSSNFVYVESLLLIIKLALAPQLQNIETGIARKLEDFYKAEGSTYFSAEVLPVCKTFWMILITCFAGWPDT